MSHEKTKIERSPQNLADLDQARLDPLAPLASQSLFWRARYVTASSTLEAIPLIFWLTEAIRPRIAVTLGMADAVPHFALCQAVEKLGLESMCLGFEEAGEAAADLGASQEYNDTHYAELSQILVARHETATDQFADASVDFLLINQPVTQPLIEALDRHWLPRLSEHSVILFLQGGEALRAYFDQLTQDSGSFTLDAAKGIHLALYGHQHSERLKRLCQFSIGKPGYLNIRNIFIRVGELHSKAEQLKTLEKEHQTNNTELAQKQKKIQELSNDLSENRQLVTQLQKQFQDKAALLASAQAEAFDLEASLKDSKAAAEELEKALRGQHKTLEEKVSKLETELATARSDSAIAASEHEAALKSAEEQAKTLRAENEAQEKRARQAEQSAQQVQAQLDKTEAELQKYQTDISMLEARLEEEQKVAAQVPDLEAALKSAEEQAKTLRAENEAQEKRARQAEQSAQQVQAQLDKTEAELHERYTDISVLGNAMEEQSAQAEQEMAAQFGKLKEMHEIERQRNEAMRRVADLEASRSWRITAPLRKVSLLVKGD